MSRLTQYIDYLNIEPKDLSKDYIKFNYTSISIGEKEKATRRKYRKSLSSREST